MKLLFLFLSMIVTSYVQSQPSIKVEVSKDTVAVGDIVEVTYTIENGSGNFEAPDFSDLPLISGPNTSSSFVYQNGKMSSSQSYTYLLKPQEEGKLKIPQAMYVDEKDKMKIEPVEIFVNQYGGQSKMKKPQTPATPAKPAREKKKF